jgi:hypothetical protein
MDQAYSAGIFSDPTRQSIGAAGDGGGYSSPALEAVQVKFCGINASM